MTTTETTTFETFCPGMLEVLSIGKGDLKLTLGGDDPGDIERARDLIEEMMTKGYSIFVETDDGPEKVTRFNPKRMSYSIADAPDQPAKATKPRGRPKKAGTKEVPVAGSRSTAVGRTAGG